MGDKTAVCHVSRVAHIWPGIVVGVLCLPGCLEPFSGSNVQIDFAEAVQTATPAGGTQQPQQPPVDTFYTLYASDLVYIDADNDGRADLDENGEPLIDRAYLYEVQRFEIRRLIDRDSPCFIDLEGSRFPGIHVTKYADKLREMLGVTNPYDDTVPRNDAIDVLTADRRVELLPRLENELKAVVSSDAYVDAGKADFRYPATAPMGMCVDTNPGLTDLPHPTCMDDASNALRLRLCEELWEEAGPSFYEGSDKVFTLPLRGKFYGLVEGMNPINDGYVGGSGFYVDENLVDYDAYVINWQYKDMNGDGVPDAPPGMESTIGQPYLFGRTGHISRGVVTAPLRNLYDVQIRATIAVFPDLGNDHVNF